MTDLVSLIAYISVFSVSALLLSFGVKRSSKFIRSIAVLIPIVFVGLRLNVGTDYVAYVYMYDLFSAININEYIALTENSIEIGYYLLIQLAQLLGGYSWVMFFLSSLITISVAYLAIKRLAPNNIPMVFFLYLMTILPFTLNGIRQGIAMSIVFFALSYIISGKFKKFLLFILLAATFHTSALLLLPLYLLRALVLNRRYDNTLTLTLSVVLAATVGIGLPVLVGFGSGIPLLGDYLEYEGRQVGVGLLDVVFKLVPLIAVFCTYMAVVKKDKSAKVFATLILLEVATLGLGSISAVFIRVSYYLAIGGLVYLALIPSSFSSHRLRRLMKMIIVLYGIVFFVVTYYLVGYSEIFPYNWVIGA